MDYESRVTASTEASNESLMLAQIGIYFNLTYS